ncbi:MAG TPA: NUDIX hydrolase [Syntrophobacteraceae bacterium]|nr:NUDIX hydrolase [Syntrophobacteraceae bacterium]
MNYCSRCGTPLVYRTPSGDNRPRFVCETCRTVHYENPKLVVGSIPEWQGRILLCRRSIDPRSGKWTLPAGFLENGETVSQGAAREALEEAGARLTDLVPFAMFNIPYVNQVHLMFRAKLEDPHVWAGPESLEVGFFEEEGIPWNELAFPVVKETLKLFFLDRDRGFRCFHLGDIPPISLDEF